MSSDSSDLKEPPAESVEVSGQNVLRVQIAELAGWERWKSNTGRVILCKPRDERQRNYWLSCGDAPTIEPLTDGSEAAGFVPDYLSDLNACAEAERATIFKDVKLYLKFANALKQICGGEIDASFATAEQRSRALVETMEGTKI